MILYIIDMKRFFATLFFILLAAGVVFFFGWAQMGVPPDSVGVIRSKTHNVDPTLVRAGEFRWVWYKVIPTNARTDIFRLNTVYHEFSAKNNLPSGQVYSAFYGIDGGFSWEMNAVFSFSLRPDSLIPLVTAHNISTQDELGALERDSAGQIEEFILRRFNAGGEFAGQIEDLLRNGGSSGLTAEVEKAFPQVTGFSLRVKSAVIPDFNLYLQIKSLYDEYIAGQKAYISESLKEKSAERVGTFLRFGELEQYGALITKYPLLLEYLALEGGKQGR
jgi:hypothetical protein